MRYELYDGIKARFIFVKRVHCTACSEVGPKCLRCSREISYSNENKESPNGVCVSGRGHYCYPECARVEGLIKLKVKGR